MEAWLIYSEDGTTKTRSVRGERISAQMWREGKTEQHGRQALVTVWDGDPEQPARVIYLAHAYTVEVTP